MQTSSRVETDLHSKDALSGTLYRKMNTDSERSASAEDTFDWDMTSVTVTQALILKLESRAAAWVEPVK